MGPVTDLPMRWGFHVTVWAFAACAVALAIWLTPVQAAPAPTVPPCEAINQAGTITVYRCQPNDGAPYLVNSVGWMEFED